MEQVIKYKSYNGILFDTEVECLDYESKLVDKNGVKINLGDIVKLSWVGGGYSSQPSFI